jgi:hypothetical protein
MLNEETVTEETEQIETPEVEEQSEETPEQEEKKDHPNFASLRSKAQELEEQNRRYRERLAQLEQQYSSNDSYSTPSSREERDVSDDDLDLVERRDLKRIEKKINKYEEEQRRKQLEEYALKVEREMRERYTDFDKVVNNENLNKLWADNPGKARYLRSMLQTGDLEAVSEATYDTLKRYGYGNPSEYEENKRRIEENSEKPKQPSAMAQVSNLNRGMLTPDDKKRNREELERIIRGY